MSTTPTPKSPRGGLSTTVRNPLATTITPSSFQTPQSPRAALSTTTRNPLATTGSGLNAAGTYRLMTEMEVETVFSYCDAQGAGLVTAAGLKARVGPRLFGAGKAKKTKEEEEQALFGVLLAGKPTLTLAELKAVLLPPPPTTHKISTTSIPPSSPRSTAGPPARAPTPVPTAAGAGGKEDPVAKAFSLLADPDSSSGGCITRAALAKWLLDVEFVRASEQDVNVLVQAADADGDGRIDLHDFRALLLSTRLLAATVEDADGGTGGAIEGKAAGVSSGCLC